MTPSPAKRKRALQVLNLLEDCYPEAHCALDYTGPWQLLVATILSAQCTDVRVNLVTRELFARYPGPGEMAKVELHELEKLIRSTGFFRNKAKNLLGCAREVLTKHADTVGRIARRLGWTKAQGAEAVEQDLCQLLPAERWTQASHTLIFHGRQCCRAQTAHCTRCPVADHCPRAGVTRSR